MTDTPGPDTSGMGTGGLIAAMLGFVVVGAPMVYYLWTTLNQVLAGHIEVGRLGMTVLVLLVFIGVLSMLIRSIRSWEERLQ